MGQCLYPLYCCSANKDLPLCIESAFARVGRPGRSIWQVLQPSCRPYRARKNISAVVGSSILVSWSLCQLQLRHEETLTETFIEMKWLHCPLPPAVCYLTLGLQGSRGWWGECLPCSKWAPAPCLRRSGPRTKSQGFVSNNHHTLCVHGCTQTCACCSPACLHHHHVCSMEPQPKMCPTSGCDNLRERLIYLQYNQREQ